MPAVEERFWSKVNKDGVPWSGTPCWIWMASRNNEGYGQFRLGGKLVLPHRFAYKLLMGPIPTGLTIDHLCKNHACVNPEHMEVVTGQVNTLRGQGPTAKHAQATHCPKGHPYDLINTYSRPEGGRSCRACDRLAHAIRYHLADGTAKHVRGGRRMGEPAGGGIG